MLFKRISVLIFSIQFAWFEINSFINISITSRVICRIVLVIVLLAKNLLNILYLISAVILQSNVFLEGYILQGCDVRRSGRNLLVLRKIVQPPPSSEISVNLYRTARCHIPEDSNLYSVQNENLKSPIMPPYLLHKTKPASFTSRLSITHL
jgi:hypothetical protein